MTDVCEPLAFFPEVALLNNFLSFNHFPSGCLCSDQRMLKDTAKCGEPDEDVVVVSQHRTDIEEAPNATELDSGIYDRHKSSSTEIIATLGQSA
jgi:hypothetical protein